MTVSALSTAPTIVHASRTRRMPMLREESLGRGAHRTASLVASAVLLALAPFATAHAQTACDADTNGDGVVDSADLGALLSEWGPCKNCAADLNGDNQVDSADLGALLSLWGAPCDQLPWATVLEFAPNPAVVTNPALRQAITATGFPWRVRDNGTQIEMLLVPPGTFNMGCAAADPTLCDFTELPVHAVTLTNAFYIGRYEVTQAQWTAVMGSNPSFFQAASAQVPAAQVPNRPVDQISWNTAQAFLAATGLRLPTEAEWEYAYRAGTTTAYHSMPGFPNGTSSVAPLGNIAWWSTPAGGNSEGQTRPVGQKAANGFGLHDMSGNILEWVGDWYAVGYYASSPPTDPTGSATGALRVSRGGSWNGISNVQRSSFRALQAPSAVSAVLGVRVARSAAVTSTLTAVAPDTGPSVGGATITLTGTNLTGTTSVTIGGVAATNVTVINATTMTAVIPANTVGPKTVAVITPFSSASLPNAFTYEPSTLAGDDCSNALVATVGANPFSTALASPSPDPVDESQCPGTFLSWGTANKDLWFSFVPPSSGNMTISTCDPASFDTSIVLYAGTNCGTKIQIACNGDGPESSACQSYYSRIGPVAMTAGTTYWIRIGGYTDGLNVSSGPGILKLEPVPTLQSVAPSGGSTAGGTLITLTGTTLLGTTSVTIGGVPATNVTVVNATTVTAVTPPGSIGPKNVVVGFAGGSLTLADAFSYVATPSWATLVEAAPDPAVVTDPALRSAIAATGLAWRVRDTATQIEMLLVPSGSYDMGCSASNAFGCEAEELPVHAVTLTNAFYLGRYEVTQAQWTARMGSNPSFHQNASAQVPAAQVPNRPVERVSWNTIQNFMSSTGMRLPTEAEWEFACRAGTTTAFHSMPGFPNGTNDDTQVGAIAWFGGNAGGQTRPVGQKAANALGLHDILGNAMEWVNDRYSSTYYASSPPTNPPGPATGTDRVLRGGDYGWDSSGVRASTRSNAPASFSIGIATGFRVARNP